MTAWKARGKAVIFGAVVGAAVTASFMIYGPYKFITSEKAKRMSARAVVESLVPYCVATAHGDSNRYQILLDLEAASPQDRPAILAAAGWATPQGADKPNIDLAEACLPQASIPPSQR